MNYWKLDGNYLVFEPNGYEVPLQYIFTQEKLDVWVLCLSEKRWVTPDVLQEFEAIAKVWMSHHSLSSAVSSVCCCPHCDRVGIPKSAEFLLETIHDHARHLSAPPVTLPDVNEQYQLVL